MAVADPDDVADGEGVLLELDANYQAQFEALDEVGWEQPGDAVRVPALERLVADAEVVAQGRTSARRYAIGSDFGQERESGRTSSAGTEE